MSSAFTVFSSDRSITAGAEESRSGGEEWSGVELSDVTISPCSAEVGRVSANRVKVKAGRLLGTGVRP
jgi:hypothetical protein